MATASQPADGAGRKVVSVVEQRWTILISDQS